MMDKIRAIVLFGGKSSEYEVSQSSAYSVLCAMNKEKYTVHRIGITKEQKWYLFCGEDSEIASGEWYKNPKNEPLCVDFLKKCFVTASGRELYADAVFPVMHGEYGEDGRIQGLLELLEMKYVGPSAKSASLCMDKQLCKSVAMREGVPVVPYICVRRDEYAPSALSAEIADTGGDVFVKPTLGGSSVGVTRVKGAKGLSLALDTAFKYSDEVLIEKAIKGTECEVGVLAHGGITEVSEVGSLSYKGSFYDYNTKYRSKGVKYKIPAKIPEECRDLCRKYAELMYKALGCRSLCRVDFFVTEDGEIYFNEVNAIPGFTQGSMYPMLFKHSGYSLGTLIDILISEALKAEK